MKSTRPSHYRIGVGVGVDPRPGRSCKTLGKTIVKSRSNGDTCHYISESKLSFKPQRSDKIPVPNSIFIKLKSIAENKIMQKHKSSYSTFRRVTPARFLTPKSFFIAQKMTTRELSLAHDSKIESDLK